MAATAISIGKTLNQLLENIQNTIELARNSYLSVEMQAGTEVFLAIEKAKHAYSDCLDVSVDKVDKTVRDNLDRLSKLTEEVQARNNVQLLKIAYSIQQIVNTLPFANSQPQLTSTSPKLVGQISPLEKILWRFHGNFPSSSDPELKPSLVIGKDAIEPQINTTQELAFLVPYSILFKPALNPSKFCFADLKLPWYKNSSLVTDCYRVAIGLIPPNPGKITLEKTTLQLRKERKEFKSNQFKLDSTQDRRDHIDVPFTVISEPGWAIDPRSQSFHVVREKGSWNKRLQNITSDRITYLVTTRYRLLAPSGSVKWTIHYDAERVIQEESKTTEDVVLKWGDSKAFDVYQGNWKVVFQDFNGTTNEFTGINQPNPYIKFHRQGGKLLISTVDPSNLSFPTTIPQARL